MINEIKSLFKELQKEREFLYGDEIRGYIGKLTWTEWREEEEDFKVNKALYKIIDIAEEHPLIEVKIDKESGFPPWTLVEEVYSLNETLEEPPIDWEEIIENARYNLLRGKDVDIHTQTLKLYKLYEELKKRPITPLFNTVDIEKIDEDSSEEKHSVTFFYYHPVKNYPVVWKINTHVKRRKRFRFWDNIKNKSPIKYEKNEPRLSKEFEKVMKENAIFDAKTMYFMLNHAFPGDIDSVESRIMGPFYFSVRQEIKPLKMLLEGDVEKYLEDKDTDGIMITQRERVSNGYYSATIEIHPRSDLEKYGLKKRNLPWTKEGRI